MKAQYYFESLFIVIPMFLLKNVNVLFHVIIHYKEGTKTIDYIRVM